jgi:hypothetical protein
MTKIQIFAILALGGLMALGASGQTGQAGDTSSYAPAGAGQYASSAADEGISVNGDEIPDPLADAAPGSEPAPMSAEMIDNGAVTLVEPYDGYGELSLDELSAALSMPAGPQPWDLGEFARWQEPPAQDAYGEPVTIIDEGQAIIGLIELPVEGEGPGELAAAQPQALPTEPATPPAGPKPVVPNAPLMANALTIAYGAAGTVYATTADYSCEPPMYAPTYYSYYYAYPYAYTPIVLPPWSNPHWPLTPYYCIYPQWTNYYGTYIGYPYVGYFGTYASYSYGGYFGTYASYPYTGYFGTYIGYPYASYYRGYPHHRSWGSGAFMGFSFGGSSWSIYGQLGLPDYQHGYFRGDHDRDFPRHSDSRFLAHGGSPSERSFASGGMVRPWRPSVSHQIAAARNGRSFDLSTDRSRLGQHGPVDLNRGALAPAAGAGATRATALPRPGRTLTTGRTSALAPAVGSAGRTLSTSPRGMTGATAQDQLQQRRDAYMDVLRRRNVGSGGTAESPPAGVVRPAFGATSPAGTASSGPRTDHGFGAGNVSRQSSAPDIDAAVTARREVMRNDLLRRLNASPAASGSAPTPAGPTRQHSTFQPQVAPPEPARPSRSATAGPQTLAPRSLTPNSLTPRTVTTPTVSETPSVTLTPTPRTTSTAPPREMRFSSSTWPHDSTAAPSATTPPSYTPRTFTPRTAEPSEAAPSASEPRSYYTPRTFTPRTAEPSAPAPSASEPRSYYTPRTFTPRTAEPSAPAPSASEPRSYYTPRTFTPRTAAPSAPAPSASEPRSYTPRTFAPRTAAPSSAEPSFSRSAPSYSRFSPSGPTMSAPPARTFSPAPSQAPTMSRSDESDSPRSRRAATAEETAPPNRRR